MNVVVYIPADANTRAYGYGQYLFLLLEAWLRNYPHHRIWLLSRHGAVPSRLQGFTQVEGMVLKPPALAKLAPNKWLRRKLQHLCTTQDAALWMPFGLLSATPTARRVVVSLPFLPIHPQGPEQLSRIVSSAAPVQLALLHGFAWQHWCEALPQLQPTPVQLPPLVAYSPIQQSWAMHEAIKTRHAGGYEFFLYYGDPEPEDSLITLLKAFSKFKKRHHTNLQLVLLLTEPMPDGLTAKLASYAYRHAVTVLERQPAADRQRLLAACYAMVVGNGYDAWCRPTMEAMAQGTACLVPRSSNEASLLGDACLTYHHIDSLFAAMSRIFTDENARSQMREQTAAAALAYTEAQAADACEQLFG